MCYKVIATRAETSGRIRTQQEIFEGVREKWRQQQAATVSHKPSIARGVIDQAKRAAAASAAEQVMLTPMSLHAAAVAEAFRS